MLLPEAKSYIGKICSVVWHDRAGNEQITISKIHDATFVPLYGGYLITDVDDIRLDRICSVAPAEAIVEQVAATPEKVAA